MRTTKLGVTVGTYIKVSGLGKYGKGVITKMYETEKYGLIVDFMCDYNKGTRIVRIEKVRVDRSRTKRAKVTGKPA